MKKYLCTAVIAGITAAFCGHKNAESPRYLSPGAIAIDQKQNIVYTALTTGRAVAISYVKSNATVGEIKLKHNPSELVVSPDASTLYVSCGEADGTVEVIDLQKRKVKASIKVGHTPQGLALTGDGGTMYVANRFNNDVSVVDLKDKRETARIPVVREPRALALTPDGRTLAVANFLPDQPSNGSVVAAQISLVDAGSNTLSKNILLSNGTQSLAGLACSDDGKFLYAVHLLSQYNSPITQIERGWVNTAALSIIDMQNNALYASLLLDDTDRGAANPSGICIDGNRIFISLAGTHELMTIDRDGMHRAVEKFFADGNSKDNLLVSTSFLVPFKTRTALQGRCPKAVACVAGQPIVCSRFSTFLEKVTAASIEIIPLGNEPEADAVRRGELAFNDASICFQQWQSCASCHPDGRIDGLNWDQMNDGFGNPKNTKSLLYSHVTPPCMITGIRESAELAVRKGIIHTLHSLPEEPLSSDMDAYLKAMQPVESPFMAEYRRKDPQQKGKALFEKAKCSACHNGNYLTDMKQYNVGTGADDEQNLAFDTPSLREMWRTAPYLYNGKAATIKDVLTTFNRDNKHGVTRDLSNEEMEMLILYLKTL
ncbi:MAG: c-type cytochrome [Prevotellaceae bacterium]|jgi:YVTN family beta-propeller protein|nr:c-type cytochrome [Prevotellaceae bacterium]